jgi:lipoprotein signal peptidase
MSLMPALALAIPRWRQSIQTLVIAPRDAATTAFGGVALLVALGDTFTKQIAMALVPASGASLGVLPDRIRLLPVLNDQAAFGIGLGTYTWEINVVVTVATILLIMRVCKDLAAVDPWAPRILGLIAGAALGNLISLTLSPGGVPDFIAVTIWGGREIVMNFADIAAYLGLALIGKLVVSILRAMKERREWDPRVRRARVMGQ